VPTARSQEHQPTQLHEHNTVPPGVSQIRPTATSVLHQARPENRVVPDDEQTSLGQLAGPPNLRKQEGVLPESR